jgi:hypothetical protein
LEVDHGGFDVGVSKEALNGLEVVASEEEVAGKGMSEGVGWNAFGDARTKGSGFDGALDVGFVKMVAAHFRGLTKEGEVRSGKEPLPNVFPGGVFIFFFELAWEKDAGVAGWEVLGMERSKTTRW